jgi:hypothetical protein
MVTILPPIMTEFLNSTSRLVMAGRLLVVFLLLAGTGASAGSPPAPSKYHPISIIHTNPLPWLPRGPLTADEAVSRALACDSQIASLKAAVEVARQERLAATDIKDPVVAGESRAIGRAVENEDELEDARLSLGVFVPNPWLMIPRANARTADYEAARADLRAATWLVRCDVQQFFAQLDYLTNDLAFSTDEVRLGGEVLEAMQARLKQGAATASDLMTASRQYLQFQDELDQTYHRYQLARRKLAALLDIAPESFELATNAPPPVLKEPNLTFSEAETMADRERYDLAALRWRAQAAQSAYHEIYNQRWPWIKEVKGGYLNESGQYWVGLSMDVPIFSWTKNHAADAALAKAQLAAVSETNGFRQVRQEVHDALDEVDQTRRQQARNDTTAKPLIATMQQTLTTLKTAPSVMPEQVAAAELQLVETLRFDLETRWRYQLALFDLERILGAPLSEQNRSDDPDQTRRDQSDSRHPSPAKSHP